MTIGPKQASTFSILRHAATVALAAAHLSGCVLPAPGTSCPEGNVVDQDRCVPAPASGVLDADGSPIDASTRYSRGGPALDLRPLGAGQYGQTPPPPPRSTPTSDPVADAGVTCATETADCNGLAADGCETRLDTTLDCGRCGQTCQFDRAAASCVSGACAFVGCDAGYCDTDGDSSNGCEAPATAWYPDSDGDGYGNGRAAAVPACASPGAGYVADATDCNDVDARAFPGQTQYFNASTTGAELPFDFNCDGVETRLWPVRTVCGIVGVPAGYTARAGWVDTVPACGAKGKWKPEPCVPGGEFERTQECR